MRTAGRGLPVLVTLLLAALLGGCGPDESDVDAPREQVAALPGVRDATFGQGEDDDGRTGAVAVVDMEADASAYELTDVLMALDEVGVVRSRVYVGAGTTEWEASATGRESYIETGDDPTLDAARWATLLVAGARAIDGQVQVAADPSTGTTLLNVLLPDGGMDDVADALGAIQADESLRGAPAVRIATYDAGSRASGGSLVTDGPLPQGVAAVWTALEDEVAAADDLRFNVADLRASGTAVSLTVGVLLPDAERAADVTTARYGATLWPCAARLAAAIRAHGPGGELELARTGPGAGVHDVFLRARVDADGTVAAEPDRHGRTWNEQAAGQLAP